MFVTALYAALLAPIFVLLSVRVIRSRRSDKVGLGDGGQKQLLRRMRAQANFAEYVPYSLLMMALAESVAAPSPLLHGCGAPLLCGRLLHAYGISQEPEPMKMRVAGMALTFTTIITLAITLLWQVLSR